MAGINYRSDTSIPHPATLARLFARSSDCCRTSLQLEDESFACELSWATTLLEVSCRVRVLKYSSIAARMPLGLCTNDQPSLETEKLRQKMRYKGRLSCRRRHSTYTFDHTPTMPVELLPPPPRKQFLNSLLFKPLLKCRGGFSVGSCITKKGSV